MNKIAFLLKRILPKTRFVYFWTIYIKLVTPKLIKTKYWFNITWVEGDVNMRYYFYINWDWEPYITYLIQKTAKAGDIVLDIWANIWFDTMILSQCVGDTGKVYAFEPSKKIYNVLSDNIYKINKFEDNIKLINKGIGSKNETVKLYMDNNNPWGSTICHDYGWSYETIDIITIDSLGLKKVDFIKIDIEWYEYEAFLWMKKLLTNNKSIKILFEWSPQFYSNLSKDAREYSINILEYLKNLWFTLYQLDTINIGKRDEILDFNALYDNVWLEFWAHADIYAERQ